MTKTRINGAAQTLTPYLMGVVAALLMWGLSSVQTLMVSEASQTEQIRSLGAQFETFANRIDKDFAARDRRLDALETRTGWQR